MRRDCSASRPKHDPPCRVVVDGLAEGTNKRQTNHVQVQETEFRSAETTAGQANCGEPRMRRSDFQDSQEVQSNDPVQSWAPELEPRAHEKNCVCGTCNMRAVRCTVYSNIILQHQLFPQNNAFRKVY